MKHKILGTVVSLIGNLALISCGPQVGMRTGAVSTVSGQTEGLQGFFPEGSGSTLDAADNGPLRLQLNDGLQGRREFSDITREFNTVAKVSGFTDVTNENQSRKVMHRAVVVFDGQTIFDESRRGNAISWALSFEKEGNYALSFSAQSAASQLEVKLPTIFYKVDRTAPQFEASSEVNTELSTGKRSVRTVVQAAGDEKLKCSSGWLYADANSKERSKLDFEALQAKSEATIQGDADAPNGEARAAASAGASRSSNAFRSEDYSSRFLGIGALPNIWKDSVFAEITCADISGNSTTRVFPLYSEAHSGIYSVEVPFGKAAPIGGGAPVVYLNSANFSFKTGIVSKESGLAANEEMLSRFAPITKVVVSSAPLLDFAAAQQASGALLADFGAEINFPVPAFATGNQVAGLEQSLYVSFFERSRNPLEQSLPPKFRMSEKVTLRFDDKALQYEWNAAAIKKIVAKKDEFIELGLTPVLQTYTGAALYKFPVLEWSVNGVDWLAIEPFEAKTGEKGELAAKVKYPFDKEQAFRIRAKVIDRAGNESLSSVSPTLVYPESLGRQFAVDPACFSGDAAKTPLAKPDFILASSFACKVVSEQVSQNQQGIQSNLWRIQVFAVNRGGGAVAMQNQSLSSPGLFSNVFFLFKASRETFVSPIQSRRDASVSSPARSFRMSTLANLQPITLEVPEDELFSSGARLYFDAGSFENSTGYTFSTVPGSTCYLNSQDQSYVLDGRPHLILNPVNADPGGSQSNVKRSPYSCD